jgi:rSAM/selenodomain-associated transferase 1
MASGHVEFPRVGNSPDEAESYDGPIFQVFAKAPVPGFAKTRLIPVLGAEGAAQLQVALVRHCLAVCCEAARAAKGRVELWCAPAAENPFFERCATDFGVRLESQRGNDLGERMCGALAVGLQRAAAVVLVGSDAPCLAAADLVAAAGALTSGRDAVLIPALDGGYLLIGLTRLEIGLFESVEWGTEWVLSQTRRRLRSLGYDWYELAEQGDLDTPTDWQRLMAVRPEWRSALSEAQSGCVFLAVEREPPR